MSEGSYLFARIARHSSGRWEVQTALSSPGSRAWIWKLAKLFPTEQMAESCARSILPFCDSDWHRKVYYTSWDLYVREFRGPKLKREAAGVKRRWQPAEDS